MSAWRSCEFSDSLFYSENGCSFLRYTKFAFNFLKQRRNHTNSAFAYIVALQQETLSYISKSSTGACCHKWRYACIVYFKYYVEKRWSNINPDFSMTFSNSTVFLSWYALRYERACYVYSPCDASGIAEAAHTKTLLRNTSICNIGVWLVELRLDDTHDIGGVMFGNGFCSMIDIRLHSQLIAKFQPSLVIREYKR